MTLASRIFSFLHVSARSNIVGMPVAQILQSMDATVTVCHSRTPCLERLVKEADIVPRPGTRLRG